MRVVVAAGMMVGAMEQRRVRPAAVALIAAGLALGCSDSQGPAGSGETLPPSPFVVSSPVSVPPSTAAGVAPSESSASTVVYVSLPPGAIPDGRTATIRDDKAGTIASTVLVDGGFDPIPVAASIGDTLSIRIQVNPGGVPVSYAVTVPKEAPPIVVRTSPPPHKRDVPLNAIVVIVFSQPINPATLTVDAVLLWHGPTAVAGSVRLSDATNIRAEFEPDTPLSRNTDYRLVVTSAIHDVNGVALESPADVDFTTGESVQAPAKLAFLVGPGSAIVDRAFEVQVTVQDSLGFTVLSANNLVKLALGTNPGGATLAGTLTVSATNGVAVFHGLSLDQAGNGYSLAATSGTLAGTMSGAFTVFSPSAGLVFASVATLDSYTCGVTIPGAAYCWGNNYSGVFGDGTTTNRLTPGLVTGGLSFAMVSGGADHACGVVVSGAAYCWGFNGLGELGDGTTTNRLIPGPVAGGLSFIAVSAGLDHTCGVTPGGEAYCWGDNRYGQLGDGTRINRANPVPVAGGLTFAAVSAGYRHTCVVTVSGAAYCWGSNEDGKLGTGEDSIDQPLPVAVAGGLSFAAVSAGGEHSCGLSVAGAAYCWGHNYEGRLGDGTETSQLAPVLVAGGLTFAAVSAGGEHTCGLTTTGAAYCWGYNAMGGLGNGNAPFGEWSPVLVAGGHTFSAVDAGMVYSCGLAEAGVAYCWGNNFSGQVGDGTTTDRHVPVKVAGQP